MHIRTFIVEPTGDTFQTSNLEGESDQNRAYYHAHLYAAQHAAKSHRMAYVHADDLGDERLGFGSRAAWIETTYLYEIVQSGVQAYFDYRETAWLPLPAEAVSASVGVKESALI